MPPGTALHTAARDGDLGQIEDLLREGVEVDAKGAQGAPRRLRPSDWPQLPFPRPPRAHRPLRPQAARRSTAPSAAA